MMTLTEHYIIVLFGCYYGGFWGSPSVRIALCSYYGLLLTFNRRYNDNTVHQYINEKQIVYGDL